MEVTPIGDLPREKAIKALQQYRQKFFKEVPDPVTLNEVYERIGGRLTFLNRVAKSKDMIGTCDKISPSKNNGF